MDIVSKFTIASDEGLYNLFLLKETQIREMYNSSVPEEQLEEYIEQQLSEKDAVNDLNNLSTQMVTVFIEGVPVGYAIMRQSLSEIEILASQKAIHYGSFYIIAEYNNAETRASLWNKCLSVTRSYDIIWIELLQSDPLISFLADCGFKIQEESEMKPFNKPSYILIRPKVED